MRDFLIHHTVTTAAEIGWSKLTNGALLETAESSFEALITTDKNLQYQQNLKGRRLAILVLPTTNWPKLRPKVDTIVAAVNQLNPATSSRYTWISSASPPAAS